MKALIFNNRVVDISTTPFEVAETMTWVDCPDNTQTGWKYENSEFSPPQTQEELDAAQLAYVKKEAKKKLSKTDWAILPDVNISNRAEFEAYRESMRELYFNPILNPVWPTEPSPAWI
jgi:hypothetical protein